MRIGEVAARAGVSSKTVRHYEDLGLIASARLPNGYRDYGEDSSRLVAEAQLLNRLGVRLDRTRPFLRCLDDGNPNSDDCPDSLSEYRQTIAELDHRIEELERRRDALRKLLTAAQARRGPLCEYATAGTEDESGDAL